MVSLRELTHEDVTDEYLSWFRDGQVTSFLEVDGNSLTHQMVRDYMDSGRQTGNYFMYAICADGKHIGNLKVGPIVKKHKVSDLICVIGDRSYWGKGLATEAIKLGNKLAFDSHDIRKLHGQIYANNIGSIKAYCKAGWIIEGVIQGRYLVGGEPMDQVLVSCHNPKYLEPRQTNYPVLELKKMIAFRDSFLRASG